MQYPGILFPLALSFLFFLSAIAVSVYWIVRPMRMKKKFGFASSRNTGRNLMLFSLILLLSVWSLRFSVNYFRLLANESTLTPFEQFFDSFLHALQTFSMDESYTDYLSDGKDMIRFLTGSPSCVFWFSAYSSFVNSLAPIAGGAFIFEVLAGIFPQVQYYFSRFRWTRPRCYFTALNDRSFALARNLAADPQTRRALIVFTDAYTDESSEESSELLLNARSIGGICLKDDLLHVPMSRLGKSRTYIFLSDQQEVENLQTLAQLLNPGFRKALQNAEIHVFGTDRKTSYIEDEVTYICNRMRTEYESDVLPPLPAITPVNGIRSMAQMLFYRLPLFEGLYGKTGETRQLNLTIIGSGVIGTELFLNAYWFGQMAGAEMHINIVSKQETEREFVARIDGINPDVMASSRPGAPELDAVVGEDRAAAERIPQPPYFRFRFVQKDITACDLEHFLQTGFGEDGFCLRDTDYFVIAAGSDEDNFRIADKLRQCVGYYHLHDAPERKTIISYVIYNADLCRTLNAHPRQNHVQDAPENEFDVYMHAFGSMEEIYSVSNILHSDIRRQADDIGRKYDRRHADSGERAAKQLNMKRYYNTRANDARGLHLRYKLFCAGLLEPSLFRTKDDAQYARIIKDAEVRFAQMFGASGAEPAVADALAWMEHRRWTAFMRIHGFRRPADMERYIRLESDIHSASRNGDKPYQFLFIKRHPCIVECDRSGYPGYYSPDKTSRSPACTANGPDELDVLENKLHADFKQYDYPEYDVPKSSEDGE